MLRQWGTVTVRLAIGYGVLIVTAMTVMAVTLYFGTVGVIERGIDAKLQVQSNVLTATFRSDGIGGLQKRINSLLSDKVDQDTEVYGLFGSRGELIVGNIAVLPETRPDRLRDKVVVRDGQRSTSRLVLHRLSNGDTLVVGRDVADLEEISLVLLRALSIGGAIALFLAIGGALLFRRQLESRIATIRHTAQAIEAGNLSRRIPVMKGTDEFTKLDRSINQMLDRIQDLMGGVRDVSNAVAHDLRTPLGRIRSGLDEALTQPSSVEILTESARTAIDRIDELTLLFDKLLQIAEAESGARRQTFQPVSLAEVIINVVELYDASAEAKGISLTAETQADLVTFGDKDLLTSATANLVDNAIKYAGAGAAVTVRLRRDRDTASILVQDDGCGIPEYERAKVVKRFYRLDRSRTLPGNGLGLSIVTAISHLHGGSLSLEDAKPGVLARIELPLLAMASLAHGDLAGAEAK